jgi:hypothetical protein
MAFEPTSSKAPNAVNRIKERGRFVSSSILSAVARASTRYDEETVFGVLDGGAVCHVTFKLPPDEDDNPMNQAGLNHAS